MRIWILIALAIVLGIPFLLKPKENFFGKADDTVVIITPHNEAILYEFTRAFPIRYKERTGRTIHVDWRTPGGTSEIARYLKGEYYSAFQRMWKASGHPWTPLVAASFDNSKVRVATSPSSETPAQAARSAFLNSDVGIGVDIFFGGGSYDFAQQADAGRLVDCGLIKSHPNWFTSDSIPPVVSGEPFYDPQGRWIGMFFRHLGYATIQTP